MTKISIAWMVVIGFIVFSAWCWYRVIFKADLMWLSALLIASVVMLMLMPLVLGRRR